MQQLGLCQLCVYSACITICLCQSHRRSSQVWCAASLHCTLSVWPYLEVSAVLCWKTYIHFETLPCCAGRHIYTLKQKGKPLYAQVVNCVFCADSSTDEWRLYDCKFCVGSHFSADSIQRSPNPGDPPPLVTPPLLVTPLFLEAQPFPVTATAPNQPKLLFDWNEPLATNEQPAGEWN